MSVESALEEALETLQDSRKGFEAAAEKLRGDDQVGLASRFEEIARQRKDFAAEIVRLGSAHGHTVADSGTMTAAVHRAWMSLRDAVSGSDPEAILEVARTGESHAVSEFEKLTDDDDLDERTRNTLARQLEAIRATRDELDQLEDLHD